MSLTSHTVSEDGRTLTSAITAGGGVYTNTTTWDTPEERAANQQQAEELAEARAREIEEEETARAFPENTSTQTRSYLDGQVMLAWSRIKLSLIPQVSGRLILNGEISPLVYFAWLKREVGLGFYPQS